MANQQYVDQFIDFKGHRFKINAIKMANGRQVNSDVPTGLTQASFVDTTYKKINEEESTSSDPKGYTIPFPEEDASSFTLLNAGTKTWKPLTPQGQEQSNIYAKPLNGIRDDGIVYTYDENHNVIAVDHSEQSHPNSITIGSQNNMITGQYATAAGEGTAACQNQFVLGKYNNPNQNYTFAIGNGNAQNLKNIFAINKQGRLFMGLENNENLYTAIQNFPWASEVVN